EVARRDDPPGNEAEGDTDSEETDRRHAGPPEVHITRDRRRGDVVRGLSRGSRSQRGMAGRCITVYPPARSKSAYRVRLLYRGVGWHSRRDKSAQRMDVPENRAAPTGLSMVYRRKTALNNDRPLIRAAAS